MIPLSRRAMLIGSLSIAAISAARAAGAATPIRIGVLRFGTVSWELDVLHQHGFDAAHAVTIAPTDLAAAQATQVALQAGSVDMIATDWMWVTRQRTEGADWTFAPISGAVGAVIVPPDSPIGSLPALAGRRLGVAGTPLDKSWLILRAYAKRLHGLDLAKATEPRFAAPPLLTEELKAGRLDAMLTYWPYAAKAEAAGMRRVLAVEDAVRGLGIAQSIPFVGYVFSERWALQNRPAVDGFLDAAQQARELLGSSDDEWARIAPLTGAAGEPELQQLKHWYREGIPRAWGDAERQAAEQLFEVLAETGGPDLVGAARSIAPGTFWPPSKPG